MRFEQTSDPHSEIKIWTMEGDLVHSLSGHTSFVYSISVLENGDIVSGGEDRTVRIWRGEWPVTCYPGVWLIAHRRRVLPDSRTPCYLSVVGVRNAQRRYCDRMQRRNCAHF